MKFKTIHEDNRGSINLLEDIINYPEITVFYTKAGYARGGCLHETSDEYSTIISGLVTYFIGDNLVVCKDGESIKIPKNTSHYYVSHSDSIVLEWGANPEEKKTKHKETRAIVDKINISKEHLENDTTI